MADVVEMDSLRQFFVDAREQGVDSVFVVTISCEVYGRMRQAVVFKGNLRELIQFLKG